MARIIASYRISFLLVALLILLAACGPGSATTSATATATPTVALDNYGAPIAFPRSAPQRIISLLPSTSELLAALGLQQRIVGVDYYTNYPASLSSQPRVSNANGAYNVEQIVALKPDLVLSYGGDTKQYDPQLKQLGINVVDLPQVNLTGLIQQVRLVGRLTFTPSAATTLAQQMQQQVDQIKAAVAGTTAPTALLEVDDSIPGKYYVFGGGAFGDELAQDANVSNIFHNNSSGGGYPQVTDEAIISANPQFVILTEDPAYGGSVSAVYNRPNWGNIAAVVAHHVYHINVDIMQRPGPRLVEGLRCLAQIVHPDKFAGPLPDYCSGTV